MTLKQQVYEPVNVTCACGAMRYVQIGTSIRIRDIKGNVHLVMGGTILSTCRMCGRDARHSASGQEGDGL